MQSRPTDHLFRFLLSRSQRGPPRARHGDGGREARGAPPAHGPAPPRPPRPAGEAPAGAPGQPEAAAVTPGDGRLLPH